VARLVDDLLQAGSEVLVIARRCSLEPHPGLRWIRVRGPVRPATIGFPCFWVAGSVNLWRHRRGIVHAHGVVVGARADVLTAYFCHHALRAAAAGPRAKRATWAYRMNAALAERQALAAERWALRPTRTRCLIALAPGGRRELARYFAFDTDSVKVVPCTLDVAAFARDESARAEVRHRLGLSPGDLLALFVGGDWQRKGLPLAIEATARAGWHLAVVGDGDESAMVEVAERHGAADRLHFIRPPAQGRGRGSEFTRPAYSAADAFVLPSAYETFSLVAHEAAAAGLPILATRVNGIEDLISEGENGWFVSRTPEDIARRLDGLRDRGADGRDAMGDAARRSVAHLESNAAARHHAIYRGCRAPASGF
jgi:UDP-glucose:(heptosyl)LPS alpha-1,3-glucosyltransferase